MLWNIEALPTIPTTARYDQEMFDFHNKIEALEEQWGREKQELAKVFDDFFLVSKVKADGNWFSQGLIPMKVQTDYKIKLTSDQNDLDKTQGWFKMI